MDRSYFAAEWSQHRNNTVAVPGSECPNPITRPFDTETDSEPDPDLASPWTFSDSLKLLLVNANNRALGGWRKIERLITNHYPQASGLISLPVAEM
jgi:hypothetical protein